MKIEFELQNALLSNSKEKINHVFEKIYNDYFKLGIFIALQYLNENEANDITEDVFVSFFEKILKDKKSDISNIKQYICVSIKNASVKRIKEQKNSLVYNDEFNYQTEEKPYFLIESLFADLTNEEQYIIVEHVILDKTFKKISVELGRPLNSIKSIYRRAVIKTRRKKHGQKKDYKEYKR